MNLGSQFFRCPGGNRRARSLAVSVLAVHTLTVLCFSSITAAKVEEAIFYDEPKIGWKWGDHHIDFNVGFRYRYEDWRAFGVDDSDFHALRTRFGLEYRYRETFRFTVQAQQSSLIGLEEPTPGTGTCRVRPPALPFPPCSETSLYRAVVGESDPNSFRLSQLIAEAHGLGASWARLGRAFVDADSGVRYAELLVERSFAEKTRTENSGAENSDAEKLDVGKSSWKFLQRERLSQRLLGSADWSHGARAFDGASGGTKLGDHHLLHAYVFEPTTGVYDLKGGFSRQNGVIVGGGDWLALRGNWFEDTEIGAFFIAYSDDRDASRVAGLEGDILVYTFGASWLGVYSVGPGQLDALAWGAFQFGDYVDRGPVSGTKARDQLAGAVVAEVGYRLPSVWAAPWLRLGFNYASGDGDLDDGDRNTFFNLLPSNHQYYGYADQLALQNLLDLIGQVKFVPTERIHVELTYHRFWLDESADFRWSGTGAFNTTSLGFARNTSNGSRDVGHEVDLVLRAPLDDGVILSAGYSAMLGGDVFGRSSDSNLDFAFVEMAFEY